LEVGHAIDAIVNGQDFLPAKVIGHKYPFFIRVTYDNICSGFDQWINLNDRDKIAPLGTHTRPPADAIFRPSQWVVVSGRRVDVEYKEPPQISDTDKIGFQNRLHLASSHQFIGQVKIVLPHKVCVLIYQVPENAFHFTFFNHDDTCLSIL
jgi:hypothetical protein